MSNCTTDLNCAAPRVCYTNPQWTSKSNFCDCESWYGWSGDDCLTLTSGSVVLILSAVMGFLLATIALVLSVDQLLRTLRKMRPKVRYTKHRVNTAAVSLGFLVVSLLGLISWRLNLLIMVTSPADNSLDASSNGGSVFKLHQRIVAERIFVGVTVLSLGCALLEVSLVWLEIAEGELSGENIVRARKYRSVITAWQLFWVLLYVICASLGEIALLTFFTLPVIGFVLLTFCLARRLMFSKFARAIEAKLGEGDSLSKTIARIQLTTSRVIVAGVFAIFGGGIYVIMTLFMNYRNVVRPGGTMNAAAFFSEFVPWSALVASLALLDNLYERQDEESLFQGVRKLKTQVASNTSSFMSGSVFGPGSTLISQQSDEDTTTTIGVEGRL